MNAVGSSYIKDITIELGGKSPAIVFDDADLEKTATWVVTGLLYVSSSFHVPLTKA